MPVPVINPKLEMAQEAATVVEWLKREGEPVEKGEPLLTVETDKVTVEIESPASGILAGVRAAPGQVVPVTEVIAYILQPGEELGEPASRQIGKSANQQISRLAHLPFSPSPPLPLSSAPATPVAQRLAAAAGVDLSAVQGTGLGGRITKSDVMAAAAPSPGKVRATPAARRSAREQGVDLQTIAGSGPRGRVQAADVATVALTPGSSPEVGRGETVALTLAPSPEVGRGETVALTLAPSPEAGRGEAMVVPLAGMRRTIAERMTASYREAPHITFTARVDVSGFEQVRAQFNAKAQVTGQPRASVTVLIVKAVAWALKRHPYLNSTLHGDEIHLLPEVNVGVAVALEEGLIVPVVHDADRKSVGEIAAEVHDLTIRAREGRLVPADVAGGTFTVSNLGPFGIEQFTAIINPPQAAILAVGATQREAVVDEDGQVVARPIMRMTLSADHRIVDGAIAARFLSDLREALEAPALILW